MTEKLELEDGMDIPLAHIGAATAIYWAEIPTSLRDKIEREASLGAGSPIVEQTTSLSGQISLILNPQLKNEEAED